MKKYKVLVYPSLVMVAVVATAFLTVLIINANFYLMPKDIYLSYDLDEENTVYMEVGNWLRLKGYPEQTVFSDRKIIKKVLDYLNSIPLAPATKEELPNSSSDVYVAFYDGNNNPTLWIQFWGQEFIGIGEATGEDRFTERLYRTRDVGKGAFMISGLEALDFD